MIRRNLLDLNVLIALTEPRHDDFQGAVKWFSESGKNDWGLCALTEIGFVRVTTNPSFRPAHERARTRNPFSEVSRIVPATAIGQ